MQMNMNDENEMVADCKCKVIFSFEMVCYLHAVKIKC